VPIVGVEAIAPERGDFNWRDYYIDALRAFDEPLIHRKVSNPESPPARGSPAQYIPRRIDSRSVLRVALESAIRQRRPLAFLVDEAQHLAKIAGGRKLQDQLDCLKSLAIRTQTVHVLAGTYDLLILRQLSGQLSRRTRHIHFARYRADTGEDVRDFQNVLWNFQIRMPLAAEPDLLRHWEFCYERSLGCVGLLKEWLTRALATGLAQKTPQVTLRLLEQQALSLADCQKIALEMREGEAILAEADGTQKRLRTLLALDDVPVTGTRPVADTGVSPTSCSTPRQHPTRVGERTPTRDRVGVARRMSEAPTP
jgi:AAA domain